MRCVLTLSADEILVDCDGISHSVRHTVPVLADMAALHP